jgi:DNA-binding NarL/FixJ family response regulator
MGRATAHHPANGTISVVVAEDHNVIRRGLCMLLNQQPGIAVVEAVPNGREALLACERLRPNVVLMDLFMPSLGGVQATQQIKRYVPGTRIIMLSGATSEEQVLDALRAGADGYLGKSADIDEVALAIRSVTRGNRYFSQELTSVFDIGALEFRARDPERRNGIDMLTQREREVLQLIGEGRSNQEIANELSVSVKTVEAHRAHLKEKLHARNRRDLILAALQAGMVEATAEGTEGASAHVG